MTTAVRGRPSKRRQILDAAAQVFVREGFAHASLDAIAAEAGVVKQTIYNHFEDKNALVTAVFQGALDPLSSEFSDVLAETLGASGDVRERLTAFGRRWIRLLFCEGPATLRSQMVAGARNSPELAAALLDADRGVVLREVAEHLARIPELRIPDLDRAARQLRGLLLGEAHQQSAFGQRELTGAEVADVVESGVDLFLRAYAEAGAHA
ncbi:TetR family transcriptional regulator [Lentzea sp. NBRC 105346]|uniref:TetR/AcrR family transcriptional regulator n=1 Tax=Lentzea sp. NBRC 105346 TaxID=3032205 RepID=UPI0024A06B8A|nr:TetR/AcrR family transcriptional regulator [Lentzea sp. NBRC 105346]GLZ32241.1 TetR family transcriptional regulator [Lentzea sp. NBRC 105346]